HTSLCGLKPTLQSHPLRRNYFAGGMCCFAAGLLCTWCLLQGIAGSDCNQAKSSSPEPHRSPIDVALIGDGRLAVTANHTADSVSLVDLDHGKVLAEQACGRKP